MSQTDIESQIRESIDKFMLVSKASCGYANLHIPDGDSPLCGRAAHREPKNDYPTWKRKPVEVYPPGYKEMCDYCKAKWEDIAVGENSE